jgi:alpha-beta hydrolase superfamily lysophospholipase
MIDYGMTRAQAERAHLEAEAGRDWDDCLEALADEAEDPRQKAACLIFAQMAFNNDTTRKRDLYQRMVAHFQQAATQSPLTITKLELPYRTGRLFAWHCRPHATAQTPTVLVFGGMSGWATAYLSLAEALCANNLSCLLVDAPGQGETRLTGKIYLDANVPEALGTFITYAQNHTAGAPVGIWGNSFGGLLAGLTAAADPRIAACCINGAPTKCEEPPFRTAAEQLSALLGLPDLSTAAPTMAALAHQNPITCPLLILEGGADPLAPIGTQSPFRTGNTHPATRTITWPDGEHTIYNHGPERNALVSRWFANTLQPS